MKINKKQHIKIDFNGGQITSDAGLLLLKQFDDRLKFTESINDLIDDPRQSGKIRHTQAQLLFQRLYQIIAGYEDCNDSDLLRNDPVLRLIAGKEHIDQALGSQPTLSRLENRITRRHIVKLKQLFVQHYIRNIQPCETSPIILDCDSTGDPLRMANSNLLFSTVILTKGVITRFWCLTLIHNRC